MNADGTAGAVVIGLDGVPWELVERWSASGDLPTFARLMEEGAAGPLESTTPASTPLAWPSIATGSWPDGHGLYWFRRLGDDYSHRVNTSRDLRRPTLWELLDGSVVGNVPMTYPAADVDGAMVTGMMTATREEGFTHPPELAGEIDDRVPGYEIGLDWAEYDGDSEAFLADFEAVLEARVELMEHLMTREDPRLFFFVYTEPDRLQHLVWDESTLLDHYRRLDDVLARALEYADERSMNLLVVSDHGFGPVSTVVSVNRVLENAGYLERRENTGTRGFLEGVGITKATVSAWFDAVGIDEGRLVDSLPQAFVDMASLQIPGERVLYDVDYGATTAFCHGEGCVYVNDAGRFADGAVEPDEVDRVKRELVSLLSAVRDPETGATVLEVHDGDDLFPRDDRSPDLVVEAVDGYEVQTPLTDDVFRAAETKAAGHRSEGILLARGPDVAPGSDPDGATVVDVAPTVLHLCGEPVPAGADGRVLSEIVAADSPAADAPVRTRRYRTSTDGAGSRHPQGHDGDGDVERRLRGLGYVE